MPGNLISIEEARSRILAEVLPLPAEPVAASDALGRVVAADVVSPLDLPPFDPSAMDGFAVLAGPAADLEIIGESRAGRPAEERLRPGEAIRISTGAMVPPGAEVAVVPVERVEENGTRVKVPDTTAGANIRRAGDDVRAGDVVIPAGVELGPTEIGMLAALGRETVDCARRPRVAIVATGDELVPAGTPLGPGQIHDSNAAALMALAGEAGAERSGAVHAEDSEAATREALAAALADSDVVLVSGGVSVGPHDHVKTVLEALGVAEHFWGVRLKPGKPLWFGGDDSTLVFGLPGNPVSAIVTFLLFARPALRAMQGADPSATRTTATLDAAVRMERDREQAVRCRLRVADDGWHVETTGAQGSHVLSSMLGARALALIPAGEGEVAAGDRVEIELL
jgi:molybdopterin molybdotransferase